MLCFRLHQNRTTIEEFDIWGVMGDGGGGLGYPDFKDSEKPHTEWWSHCTPKFSNL